MAGPVRARSVGIRPEILRGHLVANHAPLSSYRRFPAPVEVVESEKRKKRILKAFSCDSVVKERRL